MPLVVVLVDESAVERFYIILLFYYYGRLMVSAWSEHTTFNMCFNSISKRYRSNHRSTD